MPVINWALYTEDAVGRNHPTKADVINRPLRQVLTASGYDPDLDFGTGFAKATHTHTASQISDLATANTGITSVGTIATGVWQGTPIGAAYLASHTQPFSSITGTATATQGGTGLAAYTLGDTLYASAANVLSALPGNTTTTRKFLAQTGTGAASGPPAWTAVAAADVQPGTLAGAFTFSSLVTANAGATVAGGLTVSSGTSSLQALTATSLVVSGTTGPIAALTNTDSVLGYGLQIHAGGSAATRYALVVRDPGGATDYFKVATEAGKVGDVVIGVGRLLFLAAASRIVPGTTSLSLRNNADGLDNILVADTGAVTLRSTLSGITTLTATSLVGTLATAAQPNVTSVGVLAAPHMTAPVVDSGGLTVTAGGITVTGASTITGTLGGITTLTATTFAGALSGNASTATALQTPRTINGVAFDGTANVTVPAAAGTLTGSTLAIGVTASSLTSVGVLAAPHMTAAVVDSGGLTVTLGGITVTGNSSITGTLSGITTLTAGALAGTLTTGPQPNVTSVGTLTAGTWQAGVIAAAYGGTGVNNGTNTLTLAGPLATVGAFSISLTATAGTALTLPTTGTLATTAVTALTSLNSVGTIAVGTWQATPIADAYLSALSVSKLTGTTLPASVTLSSLTQVGVLNAPHMIAAVVDSGGFTVSAGTTALQAMTSTSATLAALSVTGATTHTPTWNNAATTFTAIQTNVTDTASAAASLLFDAQVGGVSKFSVRKDGQLIVAAGGVIGADPGGAETLRVGGALRVASAVAFPATQSASADPNTLDDYREGTYAPTVTAGTSGTITLTAAISTLAYVKVGGIVHVSGRLNVASVSAPTGTINVSLPFAPVAITQGGAVPTGNVIATGLVAAQNHSYLPCLLNQGSALLQVYQWAATALTTAAAQQLQAGSDLYFSFSYRAA